MECLRRRHGNKACGALSALELLDEVVEVQVGEAVDVIRQKHLFAAKVFPDRQESLADQRLGAGVDKRDPPIGKITAQQFDPVPAIGQDEVPRKRLAIVEEESLDRFRLMAKAKNEILVPIMRVVLHQVPNYGSVSNGDQRLGNVVRVFP